MTVKAVRAIEMSQVIVGYTVYTGFAEKEFPDKEYGIRLCGRRERCRMAYEEAAAGKKVAMVCSGDAGIWWMAGLMYEGWDGVSPGGAWRLFPASRPRWEGGCIGALWGHDCCMISLSDLLTPGEQIEKNCGPPLWQTL